MSKIKIITCALTGTEVQKHKSKMVLNYRVSPEVEGIAKGLLINGVNAFLEGWVKNHSSAKGRAIALAYCAAIIKATNEVLYCEPTIFVIEIAKQAEKIGLPINMIFTQKLLDYISGEPVVELENQKIKRAFELGFKAFKEEFERSAE